ncbi:tetratricopeptide repeat protein [Deinococcus aquatilis]|uniref:tetratricopeptide repeat protein n=1 Tax=Deinococcus aquatilis TaxID=519440 RepID=UPI0012FAA447|nr:tetratricopeptide repeat protein [Deinococcus aquatilis]
MQATLPLHQWLTALPRPSRLPAWANGRLRQAERGEGLEEPQVAALIGAVLTGLAPFMLQLEDLQEVSPERVVTVQALARLVRRGRGVGLLVTSRFPPPEPFEAVALSPLGPLLIRDLLEAHAGAPLPETAVEWIQAHAGGNPLFTLEYFRWLAQQGCLWNDGRRWRWRVPERDLLPDTLEALLADLLRGAGREPALRDTWEARALLGNAASEALWAAVAGLPAPALQRCCLELDRQGVFRENRFIHPLYAEVARQALPLERRRLLARRALAACAPDDPQIPFWVPQAGLEPEAALSVLLSAAQGAEATGDTVQVARCRACAADYAPNPQRGELAYAAALGLRQVNLNQAAQLARRAAEASPDQPERVLLLAELYAAQGQSSEVERLLATPTERGSGSVQGGPGWALTLRVHLNDYPRAYVLLEQHPDLRQQPHPDVAPSVARTLLEMGDPGGCEDLMARYTAGVHLTESQARQWLNVRALTRYYAGVPEEAAQLFNALLNGLTEDHSPREAAAARYNRSLAYDALSRFEEALADLEAAGRLCAGLGDHKRSAHLQVMVARLQIGFGHYEQAEEALLLSRAGLEGLGLSGFLCDCESALSALYRLWQPSYGILLARRHAELALTHARSLKQPSKIALCLYDAAQAEIQAGDPHHGLELAQEMMTQALQAPNQELRHYARFAEAQAWLALQRPAEGRAALEEALRLTADPLQIHVTGLELDHLVGDQASAALRLAWFRAHGLTPLEKTVCEYFPALATATGGQVSAPVGPSAGQVVGRSAARLQLNVLGTLCLRAHQQETAVRGRQRGALLACLLEARLCGQQEVSRSDLIHHLYPQTDEVQSQAALKALVSQTRLALGHALIQTTARGYALGDVTCDADEFLQTGETRLWRGPYLAGVELEPDTQIRERLYHALQQRAEAVLARDPLETARVGRLLCSADPFDLAALSLTLRALQAAGNHRSVGRVYGAARAAWREVGEALPESWQAFLASTAPA